MKTEKLWITASVDDDEVTRLAKAANIPSMLAKVFLSRGISDVDYIKDFLNPDIKSLCDPFLLKDLEKAASRISSSIENKEKIIIYGDYDVDGITSTSVLYLFLTSQMANVSYYIPDRIEDGYGLSINAIDKVLEMAPSLIVTVDCGIVSFDEVEYINEKGIDIIVTDHHSCRDRLPLAHAVVNPHRSDCSYPFKDLAGVGVTFKLIHGMCKKLGLGEEYLKYLDLVALGTVADVVPLKGENRVIVNEGLKSMEKTQNMGLSALMDIAGVKDKEITSYTLGFALGPRINAAGRLGDPERAVRLFTTDSLQTAQDISRTLNEENKVRQETENEILELALLQIESDPQYKDEPILIVYGKKWHHGVIGIVSSRITERYYKPSIVISIEDDEAKGSARSIPEFSIIDALNHVSDLLVKFGGHKAAAGLTLEKEKIGAFRQCINEYAKNMLTEYDLMPKMFIDTSVLPEEITIESVKTIDMLSPFGQDNPKPLFLGKDFSINDIRTLSENRHLKLQVSNEGKVFDSIGFNMGAYSDIIDIERKFDLAFYPEINSWRNIDKVQLILKDIKSGTQFNLEKDYYKSFENFCNNHITNISKSESETFLDYFNTIFVCSSSDEFMHKINKNRSLIIVHSCACTQFVLDLFQKNNLCLNKDFTINFGKLDITDSKIQGMLTLQKNVLVNPEYTSLDINVFDNIIFAGTVIYNSELLNVMKGIDREKVTFMPIHTNNDIHDNVIIQRQDVVSIYKYFTIAGHKKISISDISICCREINSKFNLNISRFKFIKILEILEQLNIFKFKYSEKYNIILNINENAQKTELTNSNIFNSYSNIKLFGIS